MSLPQEFLLIAVWILFFNLLIYCQTKLITYRWVGAACFRVFNKKWQFVCLLMLKHLFSHTLQVGIRQRYDLLRDIGVIVMETGENKFSI